MLFKQFMALLRELQGDDAPSDYRPLTCVSVPNMSQACGPQGLQEDWPGCALLLQMHTEKRGLHGRNMTMQLSTPVAGWSCILGGPAY